MHRCHSIIFLTILFEMQTGKAFADRDLLRVMALNRRCVQRTLEGMHDAGLVHVAGWTKAGESYRIRPMYRLGAGLDVDAPPPRGVTHAMLRLRKSRANVSADNKVFADKRRNQLRRVVKRDPLTAMFFGRG